MRRTLCSMTILAALLAAGSARSIVAQTYTTTYVAGSEMKAAAYSNLGNQNRSKPIQTDLKRGFSLSASSSNGRASTSAVYSESATQGPMIVVRENSSARYVSNANRSSAFTGTHETLLTIRSAKPVRGTVYIDYKVVARSSVRVSGAVDVGNDQSYEFSSTSLNRSGSVRATVTSAGLGIRTRTFSAAAGNSSNRSPSVQLTLTVRFVKDVDPCVFTIYGKYCKPLLVGRNTVRGEIVLTTGSAVPSSPYILMFGTRAVSIPLSLNTCYLHTVPVLTLNGATDYSGSANWTLPLPKPRPSQLFVQGVSLDLKALTFFTTNGLRIDC